ncbi:hypothetical protein LC087_16815 [Bacillus carboniphilus]|uniref:Uncharacterized protein n=1 Tax=Bacillus carboniphilus TaxID=86663 RepID=A0ABY9JSG9_9BACI|nr:hypothetical protein [Bacillus carboniphilus]WLR42349.1 hypothetical protein LC087_16815 [Bacillus carboniphilus]
MKRYWKIIALCIVSVLVLGTFYIQSFFAAEEKTTVEFEKVSGDQDELNNLLINATYEVDDKYRTLKITNQDTVTRENQTLVQQVLSSIDYSMKNMIDGYKSFMRGKDHQASNFYEDNNLLVYADIKEKWTANAEKVDFTFNIDVLEKKDNKRIAFEMDVPTKDDYYTMNVVDVQVYAGKLKVVVRQDSNNIHVYTFQLEKKKLVNHEVIFSVEDTENGWVGVSDEYPSSTKPQKYLLMQSEGVGDGKVVEDGQHKLADNGFMLLNIEKNQLKKLMVPEYVSIDASTIIDSSVYFHSYTENGSQVFQYDIKKEEWSSIDSFDFLTTSEDLESEYIELIEGENIPHTF